MRPSYLLAALALTTFACADPVEGRWRSDTELSCGAGETDRIEFEVLGDLSGEGGVCSCDFDFTIEPRGDDRYRFDIDFDGPCLADDGKYDCDLERDGQRLDCNTLGDFDYDAD